MHVCVCKYLTSAAKDVYLVIRALLGGRGVMFVARQVVTSEDGGGAYSKLAIIAPASKTNLLDSSARRHIPRIGRGACEQFSQPSRRNFRSTTPAVYYLQR